MRVRPLEPMDLVVARIADPRLQHRRRRALEGSDRHVPRRVDEVEMGGVQERGGVCGTLRAEDATTLSAVLQ